MEEITGVIHKTDAITATRTKGTTGNSPFKTKVRTGKDRPQIVNIPSPQETSNTHHQTCHQTHTNSTTNSVHQAGSHSPSSNSDCQTPKHQIKLSAETFNCHGFAQSSEYVINRLKSCDILCLTETWIWPHEVNLISDTIHSHPKIQNSTQEYTVISKCGMHGREPDYSGRGYGGVSVIVKKQHKLLHKRNQHSIRSHSSSGHA